MLNVRATLAALVALIAVTHGIASRAQQTAGQPSGQTVFSGGVNLVEISVVATDSRGRPVHGLTKDDFSVVARDGPRPIEGFAEIASTRPAASPFPATLAKDVSDNLAAKSDRVVILVLDDLHLSHQTDEVKALAARVVNGLGEGTSMGLITTSGSFGIEPTADRARLLEVIGQFVNKVERSTGFRAAGGPAQDFDDLTMMKANQDVAHMLIGQDSPRIAFIWLSKGVSGKCPLTEEEDRLSPPSSFDHRCKEMMYQLQRANVSTYAVDPGGGVDRPFLSRVSEATGGFAVAANDLDGGLNRIIEDLNNYYLIGFVPSDPKDTHYREIEVRVDRPGVTLRYRQGYTATVPPNVNTPRDLSETERLVAGVLPKTDLHLRLSATALAPPAKDGTVPVAVTVEVHGDATHLIAADGSLRDTLKVDVVAVDLRRKKAEISRTETLPISLLPEPSTGDVSYAVTTELRLSPDLYQLRASGESKAIGTNGSVYLIVRVPDTRETPLSLGGLLVGYAAGTHSGTAASGDAEVLPFLPTLDRDFTASDVLRIRCGIFRAKTSRDVDVALDLLDAAAHVIRSTPERLASTDPPQFDTTIPLAGLTPGAYLLRVTVTGAGAPHTQELGITVH